MRASGCAQNAPQFFFAVFCLFSDAIGFAVCAHVPPPEYPMHKKRAHLFSHALKSSPSKGLCEYMKRQCARWGAPSLTCRSQIEMLGRISLERLVSVDANSRRDGFLPAAPQLHGFGISPTSAKRRVLYHNFGQFSGTPEDFRQKPPDFRRQPSGLTGKAPGLSRKRYIPPCVKDIYLLAPKVYTSFLQRHIPL